MNILKIFIDADGCPVVDQTIKAALKNNIQVIIVCDTSHIFEKEGAQTVVVSKGADSADFKLVNMLEKNDIAVTQDYGLASMCLAKGAFPINQNGMVYDNSNIMSLMEARHFAKKARMNNVRLKGPKKRTKQQDEAYEKSLASLISGVNDGAF